MTDNTSIWDSLAKTDPNATKSFKRAGGFSGTAVKPQWVIHRLTEEFGPVGLGWGMDEPSFQIVPGDNKEVLVFCTVRAWHGNQSNFMFGVGGDKVVTHIKANEQYNRPERWENDDEAFKKAYTDALMNAFKFAGVASDVHMGLFDDNKYVAQMRDEFREEKKSKVTVNVHEDGPDWYGAEGSGMSSSQAKKDGWGETLDGWLGAIDLIPTLADWKIWCRDHDDQIKPLPQGWRKMVRAAADARKQELGA